MLSRYGERRRKLLELGGLGAAVISYPANMRYLAGLGLETYERVCLLIMGADRAVLVAPSLEAERARRASVNDVVVYRDGEDPYALAAGIMEEVAEERGPVGFDGWMPLRHYMGIMDKLGKSVEARLIDDSIAKLRAVKDPLEIEALRRSAALLQDIFERIPGMLEPGVSEADIAFELARMAARRGAEDSHALVQFAENSAIPHHTYSDRVLRRGEPVLVDMVLRLDGYYSDITRVFSLGEPPREVLRVADVVRRANEAARQAVEPDVRAGDVDRAARELITREGYGEHFTHRTGHGLGLEVHEEPYIAPGNSEALRKGMVFTVEPGIYLPGRFGVRIEDDVVVTDRGAEVLTDRLPRSIVVV